MSPLGIALLVLTGLGVFLYAIDLLSQALRGIASDSMERWLKRYTSHGLSAAGVGIVATTLLDSSSVVIILVIVLVNSGKLALRGALAVVLGANIGTTFGSQIIAFDIGAVVIARDVARSLGTDSDRERDGERPYGVRSALHRALRHGHSR